MNAGELIQDKIDQLNKQAWDIRVSDSNKALLLSREAIDLATTAYYKKGLAQGLRTLGFSEIRHSNFGEANNHLSDSLKLFKELDDKCGQSDIYEYMGIIRRSMGDYKASLDHLFEALELRQLNNYRDGESLSLYHIGVTYKYLGNLEKALDFFLQSLAIAREIGYWVSESYSLNNIGGIYLEFGDFDNALKYYHESLLIRKQTGDKWGEAGCLDNIGYIHFKKGDAHKAKIFYESGLAIASEVGDKKGEGNCLLHLAELNDQDGNISEAETYASRSLSIRKEIGDKKGQAELYLFLAVLEGKNNYEPKYSKQLNLFNKALELGQETKALDLLYKIHKGFYQLLKSQKQYADALIHLELFTDIEKEIHSNSTNQKILNLEISHKVEQSKKEAEIYRLRNIELAQLYDESQKQKEEIEKQKSALEKSIHDLKAMQAQLIQSEKMASLGELTAGIAHEIQNPLNFVNNFSEVNTELIDEMRIGIENGNLRDIQTIANDIKENEKKINHHGKRAEAIVKGMLQHSRNDIGQKEPTDINVLVDEYLRLSYHGFRAKDKALASGEAGLDVAIKTVFDPYLSKPPGNINIIPQEIGRVLLNLFNNAFYSMREKKLVNTTKKYQASISVATKYLKHDSGVQGIEIRITDNGMGIHPSIIDKIYQPFFTTKPPGHGTGLGLSISYDIVLKHSGTIKVRSKIQEGAEFIIHLPMA